ncbi:MAG: cytochrome c oxidase assembly protein, partial [Bauldia litoralis]
MGLTAALCAVFVAGMVGMAFASVPLYRIFCQVTGYGGTTQQADKAPDEVIDREVTVRFDANIVNGLGWSFR